MAKTGVGLADGLAQIYIALMQQHSFRSVIKDTGEAFTIQRPEKIIVDSSIYVFS